MARIRSVHPGLFTDEAFVSLSDAAQIFFIGLWTEADDQGVFEWKPVTLRMRLRGAKDGSVETLLSELVDAQCICSYEIEGRKLGAIRNFRKFQKPKTPNATHLTTVTIRNWVGLPGDISETPPNSANPISETPPRERPPFPPKGEKSSLMEDGGEDGGKEEKKDLMPPRAAKATRWDPEKPVPPEWVSEAAEIRKRGGLPPINAQFEASKFVDFWAAKSGKDGAKADWHATWRNWVRNARSGTNAPPTDGPRMGPA